LKQEDILAKTTRDSDAGNTAFSISKNVVHLKPGLDLAAEVKDEGTGNHRFRRSEEKDIPRGTLADRISKSTKGG
jgi:hypothetical protein